MDGPVRVLSLARTAFLEGGLSLAVATVGPELKPECAYAAGLRVHDDGRHATLFLPERPAARCIAGLLENAAVAITASRPCDYRTVQLKGRAVRVMAAGEDERALVLAYREALAAALEHVGQPAALTRRLEVWPCVAIEVQIDALYEQTPGPRAGAALSKP